MLDGMYWAVTIALALTAVGAVGRLAALKRATDRLRDARAQLARAQAAGDRSTAEFQSQRVEDASLTVRRLRFRN